MSSTVPIGIRDARDSEVLRRALAFLLL